MPLKPVQEFGAAYSNAATTEYPGGSYKDETVPGSSRDGSPLVAVTENDRLGFDEALAAEVGMTFTNVPDTALSSQRLEAHKALIDQRVDLSQLTITFENKDEMLAANVDVGKVCRSKYTTWKRIGNSTGGLSDFEILSDLHVVDMLPDGYVTDGTVSYTSEVQESLDLAANVTKVIMPNFTVLIDPDGTTFGGLVVPSHSRIYFQQDSVLQIKPNSLANYEILGLRNVIDIEIHNPVLQGDKYTHTGTSGEFGMCLAIRGACEDIRVMYPRVYEAWGDGYYLGQISNGDGTAPKSVSIVNPISYRCRRQGMSITSADGLFLYDCEFYDTKSSDSSTTLSAGPHAGLDIEPNDYNSKLRGIYITNIKGGGNDAGLFYVFLGIIETPAGDRYNVDINVNNITDFGSRGAAEFIGLNKDSSYSGSINIANVNSNIAKNSPVRVRNWSADSDLPINIDVLNAANWNTDGNTTVRDRTPLSIYQTTDESYPPVGKVYVSRMNVRSTVASIPGEIVWVENGTSGSAQDINVGLGSISTNNDSMYISCPTGGVVVNELGVFGSKIKTEITSSGDVSLAFIRDYNVTSPSGDPTLTLPTVSNIGTKLRFRYTSGGTGTRFRLRSLLSDMYINGQAADNIFFNQASGTILLEVGRDGYFITCQGTFTVES